MKKSSILFAFLAVSVFNAASAAEIGQVIVRQQWPWSTDVKIEYVITGVTNAVNVSVAAFNGDTALAIPLNAISGDLYGIAESGVGTIVIDPIAAFGTNRVALADFKVSLSTAASATNINEVLYKIFDLTSGAHTDVTRKELLNGKYGAIETNYSKIGANFTSGLDDVLIWTGVTNNIEYKTTKMVMRKVNAKNARWLSGDPTSAIVNKSSKVTQYWVQLSYDYYIAVFETTQAQFKTIRGSLPAGCAAGSNDVDLVCPVNNIYYYDVYAHPNSDYATYNGVVHSDEKICFPTNSYLRDVGRNTFASSMWTKTGYEFTLPTFAEWEYACRGGTDATLYSGEAQTSANALKLAWTYTNASGIPQFVGTKAPNAFGLYDMLGNVLERTLGVGNLNQGGKSGTGATVDDPVIDPVGNPATTKDSNPYCCGGGSFHADNGSWEDCRHAARYGGWYEWYAARTFIGFRFVIPDGQQWAAH